MTIDEQVECEQAVLASPEFKAALKKHYGIDDTRLVMVDIWIAGNYGDAEEVGPAAGPAALLPAHRSDRQRLRPADRGDPAGGRSEHDEGDPGRRIRPLAAAAPAGQLRGRPRRHNCATDIKPLEITQPDGPELRGRGQHGPLAELALRHRLQRPARA